MEFSEDAHTKPPEGVTVPFWRPSGSTRQHKLCKRPENYGDHEKQERRLRIWLDGQEVHGLLMGNSLKR